MGRPVFFILFFFLQCIYQRCEAQSFVPFFLDNGNSHQYIGGIYGCGATFCDFDKDGWDDLSLPANGSNPHFYRNVNGNMQTVSIPVTNSGELKHIVWVDYDNDGDRDLCMTGISMPVKLFSNDGNMQFTDVSTEAGFPESSDMTYGNSWGDYDRDGDLDVFIAKYDAAYAGMTDADNELYRNNGDGTFTNVADEAGIYFEMNATFMGLWMDYNNDLWPDLLITNDRTEIQNYLFHNNGDGTFTDVSVESGVNDFIWSMSNTSGDYDNDGDEDLYITNGPLGNVHKQNTGQETFADVADVMGTKINRFCWSAQFFDADNDGFQDLHVCSTPIGNTPGGVTFMKNVVSTFDNHTEEAGFAADGGWCRGNAVGDVNNDGFPDLIVTKSAPSYSSFWQGVPNENNWLKVDLLGTVSNIDGVGSRIECYAGGDRYTRFTHCGEAYNGQNSFSEFIGIGQHGLVDSLLVYWPSGIIDKWRRVQVNQSLHLVEGSSEVANLFPGDITSICEGSELNISVSGIWDEIVWFNGLTDSLIAIDTTALVYALVSDSMDNVFLTDTLFIEHHLMPDVTAVVSSPECFGAATGAIELTGVSDHDILSVSWSDSTIIGSHAEGLMAGTYSYQLFTIFNCQLEGSVVIDQPDSLQLDIITTDVLCAGGNDGTAELIVSGGTPEYNIDFVTDINLQQLVAGDYEVQVTDSRGCSKSFDFTITAPDEIECVISVSDVLCAGDSTGNVSLDISGGVSNYVIDWNGLDSLHVPAGEYEAVISDGNGCALNIAFTVSEPDPLSIATTTTAYVQDGAPGSATLTADGGIEPYTVQWSNGNLNTMTADSLESGAYWVLLTDSNGCEISTGFVIEWIAGINQSDKEHHRIYPNPASEYLMIELHGAPQARVIICDQSGRIYAEHLLYSENNMIGIAALPPGNYVAILFHQGIQNNFNFIRK